MNTTKPNAPGEPVEWMLPPVGERVIVDCGSYRRQGYRDQDGKWRSDADKSELTDVAESTGWV